MKQFTYLSVRCLCLVLLVVLLCTPVRAAAQQGGYWKFEEVSSKKKDLHKKTGPREDRWKYQAGPGHITLEELKKTLGVAKQ